MRKQEELEAWVGYEGEGEIVWVESRSCPHCGEDLTIVYYRDGEHRLICEGCEFPTLRGE
jgi:ribosomal protein S27AE